MNILLISSLTNDSGSGKRLWSLASELGRLGHRVHYLERAKKGTKKVAQNVVYHSSPVIASSLVLEIIVALFYNIACSLFIRAEIVFVLKPLPNSCIPALFKKLCGAKIIVDIDDLDFEYYDDGFLKKMVKFFYRVFPRHFDMITVHTKALKEYVINEMGIQENKVVFLPQGIDYKMFAQTHPDEQLRQKLELTDCKILVFAASLGITAHLEYTFEVLRNVLQERNGIKLLVIGGGSHLDNYRKMASRMGIERNVVFAGYVPHKQVPKYLTLGDVALNYYEPNEANKYRAPIKIREYLAIGIPVVCNLEGDTHLFSEYVWVFRNAIEYQEQIINALDENDKSRVKAGQEFVAQNYDWEKIVPEFERKLSSL